MGQGRFQKETGISLFHVSKYWPKYSDAIVEAGFKPNEPWVRYDDELLIKKSIEKIRKYGRYPSLNELFVEFNKGDDFPFHIFKKRSQPYMVGKIVEYCKDKLGYEDIIQACNPIIEKLNKKEDVGGVNTDQVAGEVYLMKSGRYYKIGKTDDVLRRGREINIQLPEKTDLIHTIKTDDMNGIETYWHQRFNSKRKKGEWFGLDSSDVRAFKAWRKIY